MPEETIFGVVKVYFFSGSLIDKFDLVLQEMFCNSVEIRTFWYILSQQLVCIFDCSFLPGRVRVGKEDRRLDFCGYHFMCAELRAIIGCN